MGFKFVAAGTLQMCFIPQSLGALSCLSGGAFHETILPEAFGESIKDEMSFAYRFFPGCVPGFSRRNFIKIGS
ncbi:MAG: hypothetical protein H6Q43_2690 [Deltaproteobacteria bacterium]|nr:hypothetical protein [Deltaproteobacteria bacterium]MBP1719252.1 hypothetical protein [Deltaproteobacteria bacterium]